MPEPLAPVTWILDRFIPEILACKTKHLGEIGYVAAVPDRVTRHARVSLSAMEYQFEIASANGRTCSVGLPRICFSFKSREDYVAVRPIMAAYELDDFCTAGGGVDWSQVSDIGAISDGT